MADQRLQCHFFYPLSMGTCTKWRVNHYQSSEAILGWLVLQPVEHKWTLDELSEATLDDLGSALGSVQKAMKRAWTATFPADLLERIHTTNFMESEFDEYKSPPGPTFFFHTHIFLIPRSQELGKVIRRELTTAPGVKQYVPWDDYQIFHRIKNRDASDLIEKSVPWDNLQKYINSHGEAGKQVWKDKIEKFMNQLWGQ